ncbi:MAG TPA: radical SAM protein [Methanoregulaceae archaeon]|nr:radical SAM protein [Methanoregulaceae archaeon]
MIRISRLVHGREPVSRAISGTGHGNGGPVVFWNVTARCNLRCVHCYLGAGPDAPAAGELTTSEALGLVDEFAAVRAPVVLFSGGEPLLRGDLGVLAARARARGLATALSTNGTLITAGVAGWLAEAGFEYVGISLDGASAQTHDALRGMSGSFGRAVEGMRHCVAAGVRCGLRVTVTRDNAAEIPGLLRLARETGIQRFCLYWLVPSGRGREAAATRQVGPAEIRRILDLLYRTARETAPEEMEILTVDAPQDAVFVLERLRRDDPARYGEATRDVRASAACSAGDRVVNIDPRGRVYPCQFAQQPAFEIGNVRTRPFRELWNDPDNPVLTRFRLARRTEGGRCGACASRDLCGAGCMVRGLAGEGGLSPGDPFCSGPEF